MSAGSTRMVKPPSPTAASSRARVRVLAWTNGRVPGAYSRRDATAFSMASRKSRTASEGRGMVLIRGFLPAAGEAIAVPSAERVDAPGSGSCDAGAATRAHPVVETETSGAAGRPAHDGG